MSEPSSFHPTNKQITPPAEVSPNRADRHEDKVIIKLFKKYTGEEKAALEQQIRRQFSASKEPVEQLLEGHKKLKAKVKEKPDFRQPLSQLLQEAENIHVVVKGTTYPLPDLIIKLGFSEMQMVECIALFTLDPEELQHVLQTQFEAYEIQRDGLMRALGTTNIPIADEVMDAMRSVESGQEEWEEVYDYDKNVIYCIQLEGGQIGAPEVRVKIAGKDSIKGAAKEFFVAVTRNSLEKQAYLMLFKNYKEKMLETLKEKFSELSPQIAQEILGAVERITREVVEQKITKRRYKFIDSDTKDSWLLLFEKTKKEGDVIVLTKINERREIVKSEQLPFVGSREVHLHRYLKEKGVQNLPKIFDYDEEFIAVELVGKNAWEAFLGPDRIEITADQLKEFCFTVAETLEGMHGLGYAHFDINPENTLVQRNEKGEIIAVKVTDVGLARKVEPGRHYQLGKLFYFAPEMFFPDKPVGVEADIYALGAMAFALKAKGRFYLHNFSHLRDKKQITDLSKRRHEEISNFSESRRIRFFLNRLGIDTPTETISTQLADSPTDAVLSSLLQSEGGMNEQDASQYLMIYKMLDPDPTKRPTAKEIKAYFS